MKIVSLTFVVLALFIACIHAFNSESQLSNSNADPKLREGVINWIKDQFNPEFVKTWYWLSTKEWECIKDGFRNMKVKIEDPTETMIFIENNCPSSSDDAVKKLYQGLREYVKKESWGEDMPESIRVPMQKIINSTWHLYYTFMWHLSSPSLRLNIEHMRVNLYNIFDAFEEILNALEEDREVLAKKHAFWARSVTGNLHSDSIKIVQAFKKIFNKDFKKSVEFANALKNWLKETKIELIDYFDSRIRPETNLPDDIDRKFTEKIGKYYDMFSNWFKPILAEAESNENE